MLNQIVLVFLFVTLGAWGILVAEHQQAKYDKINQEVTGYVID